MKPGSDAEIDFRDKTYIHSYSADTNSYFSIKTLSDSTTVMIDSRRDLLTNTGSLYAPLIQIFVGGVSGSKELLEIRNGAKTYLVDRELRFMERTFSQSEEPIQSSYSSVVTEVQVLEGDELLYTTVSDETNGVRVIPGNQGFSFIDTSSRDHCADAGCRYIFSGVGSSLIDDYINTKTTDGQPLPTNLQYVMVGDKSQQLVHIVDVRTGKIVKTYITSIGRNLGDKSLNPFEKNGKQVIEGNYITPEGRLRLMQDIQYDQNSRFTYKAFLGYPRLNDIERAFENRVITENQRDEYKATIESAFINPNKREGWREASSIMASEYTGVGSAVLIHSTADILANSGRTSAGCYTFTEKDIKVVSKDYVGTGSEIISLPSTKGFEERKPYGSREEQLSESNLALLQQEMEDHLEKTGLLKPNRERLANWLIEQESGEAGTVALR